MDSVEVRPGLIYFPDKILGHGRNGTVVYEGAYGTHPYEIKVAVKRILKHQFDVDEEQISDALTAAEDTVDIVRTHVVIKDEDCVYAALWLCDYDLHHLVQDDSLHADLYQRDGYPKPYLLKLMRNIVDGLVYLHRNYIIHGDLNPSHVLILNKRARISLMGSRCLVAGLLHIAHGTQGWRSPEQFLKWPVTSATDVFNLGYVFFFLLTKGKHPFDECDKNMLRTITDRSKVNISSFSLLGNFPEAKDLLYKLLKFETDERPNASEVLSHPLFWSSLKRMVFLECASVRVENTDMEYRSIVRRLEREADKVFTGESELDPKHVDRVEKRRRFCSRNVQDLLLAIRLQMIELRSNFSRESIKVNCMIEEVDYHFRSTFPDLLMVVYHIMLKNCKKDPWFNKFLRDEPF